MIPSIEEAVDPDSYLAIVGKHEMAGKVQDRIIIDMIVIDDLSFKLPNDTKRDLNRLGSIRSGISSAIGLDFFQSYLVEAAVKLVYGIDYLVSSGELQNEKDFLDKYIADYPEESRMSPVPLKGQYFLEGIMKDALDITKERTTSFEYESADPLVKIIAVVYDVYNLVRDSVKLKEAVSGLMDQSEDDFVKNVLFEYFAFLEMSKVQGELLSDGSGQRYLQ